MRIHLDLTLFEPPVQTASLVSFFNYALDGRHRIEAELQHPTIAAWLGLQAPGLQEEIRLAIDASAQAEALEPAHTGVIVGRFDVSDFSGSPLRVRLQEAATFLEMPLALLLEDRIADRAFLLSMLTPEERRSFEEKAQKGYVRVDHGGGLESMRTHVIERREVLAARHRLWVLFDSDALRPNEPSAPSEALKNECNRFPHYRLLRRQIENYIPGNALGAWALGVKNGSAKKRRLSVLTAYFRMKTPQRHHFNVKGGFARDAQRTDANAGDLYDDVSPADKVQLANGFGTRVGALFEDQVTEQDLRRDSGWTELRPVVEGLFARLR